MKTIRVTYTPSGAICDPDYTLGYQYDHNAAELVITPPECPDNVSFYRLDWMLPNGIAHSTEPLEPVDGAINYVVPSGLTGTHGWLTVQLKAFQQDGTEIVMQSGTSLLRLFVARSVDGGDIPPDEIDPLAQAIAGALDATGRANNAAEAAENVVERVDEKVQEAAGYAEQAANNILNGVSTHNDDTGAHSSIQSDIRAVEAIARGKATARVFDTYADMIAWLAVPENAELLNTGDNLYIRDVGVKDYWWDGETEQELEAEAPDLTDYYTKAQVDAMMPIIITRSAYDALVAAGTVQAGRVYYITEG